MLLGLFFSVEVWRLRYLLCGFSVITSEFLCGGAGRSAIVRWWPAPCTHYPDHVHHPPSPSRGVIFDLYACMQVR